MEQGPGNNGKDLPFARPAGRIGGEVRTEETMGAMRHIGWTGAAVLATVFSGCVPEPFAAAETRHPVQQRPELPAGTFRGGPGAMTGDPRVPNVPLHSDRELDRLGFEAAVAQGSNAALIMFLARNPQSTHAAEARRLLAQRRNPDTPATIRAAAGADADIVAQFDSARLSGDPAKIRVFILRHADHPLATEAQRWFGLSEQVPGDF